MNKLLILSLVIVMVSPAASRAEELKRYADGVYRYSIAAPRDWKRSYHEDGDRHLMTLKRGALPGAEIAVTAYRAGDGDALTWDGWKKKQSRGVAFRKIIETKAMAGGGDVTVKMFVFDYPFRGTRVLQRTMISKFGDTFLAVECRAPLGLFGKYTDLFNEVMASVDYTGAMSGDVLVETEEEKAAARKQAMPVKKAAPEKKASPKKAVERPMPREPRREPAPRRPVEKKRELTRRQAPQEKPDVVKKQKGGALEEAEITPDSETPKAEDSEIDIQDIEDPEAKRAIESELKTLQDMERRGLIEKVEGK
ncbi:MAG: hypothetical protein KA369_12850 [Spirochaetes bacterium]|nr:hypothetical protein [Spirochaetota bacterium]